MSKRMPQDPKVVFVDLDQKKYEAVATRAAIEAIKPMLLREIRRQADPLRPLVVIFQATSHPGHDVITNGGPFATFLRRKAGAAVVIDDYENWGGFGDSGPDYTMYILASGSKGWRKGRRLTTKQIRSLKLDKE